MKKLIVLLAAGFCLGEAIFALGWMLTHGISTHDENMPFETALRVVGQVSLLAVGLGILAWARHTQPALISKKAFVRIHLVAALGAAFCLGLFAFFHASEKQMPVEAANEAAGTRPAPPRNAASRLNHAPLTPKRAAPSNTDSERTAAAPHRP